MELMAEGSLKQKLADGWLPTPKQAAELVRVLAEAVQCAHAKGIVHRDLKPANILLSSVPDAGEGLGVRGIGTPKIVDFGLAKRLDAGDSMTQSGAIVGTASYMSPEQAKGQRADFPCDIYGLGAVLYELLTGRPPFVGASLAETLDKVRRHDPLPVRQLSPVVPYDLEVICLKCLDKDPLKRYTSAGDLAADLKRFLRGEPIMARLPGIAQRAVQVISTHQFGRNASGWAWALMLCGGINLVGFLAQAWCIGAELPEEFLWGALLTQHLLMAAALWWSLRGYRLGRGDRQGIVLMLATIAGPILVAIFARPPEGMPPTAWLTLYPVFAALLGIVVFIQGPMYWGGYYVFGAGYLALALLMKLLPMWSPILLGVYLFVTLVPLGLYLLRPRKPADIRK
jgi:serine/threonine-protein kinase